MMTTRPNRAGRSGRATPTRWMTRFGLVAISLAALVSEGCASLGNGCGSGCGTGCGSGLRSLGSRLTSFRLFRHKGAIATDACEPSLGIPVQSGEIGAYPGSMLPAPPPAIESDLQPIPSKDGSLTPPSGGASGAQGSNPRPVKSFYQTQTNGTRGEAQQARREVSPTRDPLADLPKLIVPNEAAPAAESSPPVAPTAGDRPPAELTPTPTPTAKPAEVSAGVGPGIRRFKVIEPRLAIGNLPTESGWKWLSDLGYRTVVDLRQPSEVRPGDLAAINHQGLRYLAIPMSTAVIDPAAIAQLEVELAREDSRPIFVFDGDGLRPASVGFLHLVNVRKSDARSAEREVDEMGAADSRLWKATLAYQATKATSSAASGGPPPAASALPKAKEDNASSPSSSLHKDLSSSLDAIGARLITYQRSAMSIAAQPKANPPVAPTAPRSSDPGSGG